VDGNYLILEGYDTTVGTAVPGSAGTINRIIGRVDASGNINTTTALNDPSANIRGAASTNGTDLWMSCSANGSRYSTLGTVGGSTQLSTTVTNLRATAIFNNQLYISSASGAFQGVASVGSGTPTTSGQTITALPGFPTATGPSSLAFAFFNATTLYVADDRSTGSGGGLQRWTLSAGTWTLTKTITSGLTSGLRGVTITNNGSGQAVAYATTANSPSLLVKVTDTNSAGDAFTLVATAGANTAFRGVALTPGGTTNPSGVGAASPSSVAPTQTTLLTVTVAPGTNPPSVTHTVVANLSSIGGSANQTFFDNGTNGDVTPNDNVYSFSATVANGTTGGAKTLPFTITETSPLARIGTGSISLTVLASTNPTGTGTANPNSVIPGASTLLTVNVTPGTNPPSTGLAVAADLSSIGGSSSQAFSGSGNTFTFTATVTNGTTPGSKTLPFTISDTQLRSGGGTISLTVQTPPPANDVVISQIYGGGGNTGATLKNDYIELINHSSAPVNLNGWSVQAFVSTTSTWQMTTLPNFMLQPGQYFLIQESQGAGGTDNLPTPDAMGTIPVSSTSTKVALVNNTTLITTACPSAAAAGIVDLVGYGGTDCFEGSGTAPLLGNTTADFRRNEGCFDTDQNANDFVIGSPNPRNSSSPAHDCTSLSAYGSANPSSVLQGNSTTLTVYVAGAQNPASSGITVTADLSQIGGSPSQSFGGSGSVFSFAAVVPANNSTGMKSLPVTVTDGQSRTFSTSILLSVLPLIADHITISQVYGGGGNSGATYTNDYIELYNPTASTITVTGWSLQYASAAGTSWTNKQPIGGVIGPGEYYLVELASGGANGAPIPVMPNISGDINISATTGKIALVNNSNNLSGGCPLGTDPDIVDFVGYGTGATCHEGSANAPAPGNSTAIFRKNSGSLDADQNGTDFTNATPPNPPSPRRTAPIVELGPWVSGTDPGTDDNTIPYDATITVNFSEPVTVDPGWYSINCTVTGAHTSATEAHFSDLKTYAVTPNVSFQFGEQCTVTITKTAVHDVDTDDSGPDTDNLFADYTWSFTVVGAGQAAPYPPSVHLTMGNPSGATASLAFPNNYLMEKPTYSLSYNRDKGTPNWVSWHLDNNWYGTLARVDTFRPDPKVDPSWYRVQAFDFSGTGFDRGHMTPNADRDNQNRIPINQETYLMSNMVPQSPDNNQGPWAAFEAYLRTQTDAGSEIYIVSGPNGVGGTGSNGSFTTIANGHVTVPSSTWKVALVLPQATGDDTARVTCSTRTIAIIMPNVQGIRSDPWENYLTTVDAVEALTGYDFFSNLPPAVQACIEAGTNGTNPPGTANQSASTTEDNSVTVTLQALQSNNNSLTFTIMSGPTSGSLGSVSASSCSSGACTATVTYTPAADFNGSNSFTFRANDGATHSNTSTVSIGVSEVNDSPSVTDDSKTTQEDTQLVFPSSDLTANDSAGPPNESGQALTVTSVTAGVNTHGTVGLASGTITYTPDANFNGPASFTYSTCDDGTTNGSPDSKCASATVNVNVAAVNDNPTAADDSATTDEDTPVTVNVLTNDSDVENDSLTISAVTQGSHGSVVNNGSNVTYSPNANYNGTESFTYTTSDGHGGTATATVSVTINAVNDAPVATDDSTTTNEDSAVTVNVLSNDSDVDGDSLTVSAVTQGTHGAVVNNGANITYSPALNYNGIDSFTYTTSDGHGGTATATVSVTINAVNDAPVATDDSATTNEDTAVAVIVLSNDSDVDGDSLTVSAVTNGSNGSVVNNGSDVTYSPALNFHGTDSFTYTVSDGHGGTATATVSVTVTSVNDAPVANNDSATTNEDTAVTVSVLSNDSDVDGDSLTISAVTNGSNGSVINNGSDVSYSPNANFHGTDTFTYTISDSHGGTSTASVSVTVTSVNDAPVANNDSATTNEDTALTINVLTNDSDVDGDSLTVSAVTNGSNGSVVNNGSDLTYSPNANFHGTDSFTYTITDGHGGTATANVSVTINAVNDAPVANSDTATTNEDTAVNVNVLTNDSDVDGDSLSVSAVTQGTHGAVTNNGTSVTYTPAANFNGSDSFSYTISDGNGGTATANVSVTVNAVNDAPVANNDSATTNEDTAVSVNVLSNDSDVDNEPLTINAVTQGGHGSVTTDGSSVSYLPAADFNGSDSFTYTISDGHGGTATASVSVTINAVNDAPVANTDSTTTSEDTAVTVDVLTNDSDVDGDSLTVTGVTQGSHGSVTTNGTTVTYSPAANFNGTDSFTYTISDGHGGTATASVSVTINAVNDAPVANSDTATTNEDTAVNVNVLTNDSDVDGDSLSVSAVTQGAHGSVTNNVSSVSYSPAANFNGTDSFTYTVSDGHGGTATASVSVIVNSVNDNPVAVADSATTNEDNPVTIDVVANDTDVDGDSLSLTSVDTATHGSVSIVSGKAVYSPTANYNGTDSFGYVVSDGHGGQANGVVSVTINPVNDAPTANSQSVNTTSNTPRAITLTGSDLETPSGSLTFTVTSGPSHGSLTGSGANRIYTPGVNYSGPDSFNFTVTDTPDGSSPALTSSEATVSITVNDTVPPVITLNGNSISLWPANHSYHTVNVSDLVASASDNFDPNVTLNSVVITQVTSDEVENGNGDGNTLNDIVIASDCKSVQLRAERDGSGDGRVYTVTFLVRDAAGNTTTATAKVTVPKNGGGTAVDSGPHYTVGSTCH
jgi:DNA/RNA endonuclease G (NUC1)